MRGVHRLSRILLTCPAQAHFRLRTFFHHVCDLCHFSYSDVCFLSRYVMINILLSIFVCAAASCPRITAVCHCWKYARVIDLSLQAYSNVTLKDVTVLGECCPSGRDSSLNLIWTFSIWVLLTYIGVSFSITFVFDMFMFSPWFSLSAANSCNICCSSYGVLEHVSMSSAKRKRLKVVTHVRETRTSDSDETMKILRESQNRT